MPIVTRTTVVDDEGLAALLTPADGLVREQPQSGRGPVTAARTAGVFELAEGPFDVWLRRVDAQPLGDGRYEVREQLEFRAAVPFWRPLFHVGTRRSFRRGGISDRARRPWWAPPDRFDVRAARVIGVLALMALLAGYLGSLISQTLTYAADEFGRGDDTSVQADVLSLTRIGILISFAVTAAADRRGRRPMMLAAAVGGCVFAAVGAFVPGIWALGASQVLARGCATAVIVLFGIHVAEEVPAGSRAYAVSALALAAGLGSGVVVWLLPLTDLDERAWRILYLVPLLGLFIVRYVARNLPESTRFVARHRAGAALPTTAAKVRVGRLVLLGATAFLMSLFATPGSQLQNQYLKEELGWSAGLISVFTLATNTPRSLGVVIGGRLADTRGRRLVGVVGIAGVIATGVGTYSSDGAAIWLWGLVGIIGAAVVPVLGVYGPELFPTGARGSSGGAISIAGVSGAVVGLVVAGRLADSIGFSNTFWLLAIGPVIVIGLLLTIYPETAGTELEELNPGDEVPPA